MEYFQIFFLRQAKVEAFSVMNAKKEKNLKTNYSASWGRHNINNLDEHHHFAYKASVNGPRQVHRAVTISESASLQTIALIKATDLETW